jgi:hypothetical protein
MSVPPEPDMPPVPSIVPPRPVDPPLPTGSPSELRSTPAMNWHPAPTVESTTSAHPERRRVFSAAVDLRADVINILLGRHKPDNGQELGS